MRYREPTRLAALACAAVVAEEAACEAKVAILGSCFVVTFERLLVFVLGGLEAVCRLRE